MKEAPQIGRSQGFARQGAEERRCGGYAELVAAIDPALDDAERPGIDTHAARAIPTSDEQAAIEEVDIVRNELQCLAHPQASPIQHRDQRPIPKAARRTTRAGADELLDLGARQHAFGFFRCQIWSCRRQEDSDQSFATPLSSVFGEKDIPQMGEIAPISH